MNERARVQGGSERKRENLITKHWKTKGELRKRERGKIV